MVRITVRARSGPGHWSTRGSRSCARITKATTSDTRCWSNRRRPRYEWVIPESGPGSHSPHMTTRATVAFLWAWAIWSVGASLEFLLGVPTGPAGLLLGLLAGAAILTRSKLVLKPEGS